MGSLETVINQIERCTGAQIPAQIIFSTAYTLVFNSGTYFDEICDWERKPAADRATWDQFKSFMLEVQTQHNHVGGAHHYANAALLTHVENTLRNILQEIPPPQAPTPALAASDPTTTQPTDSLYTCMMASNTELL